MAGTLLKSGADNWTEKVFAVPANAPQFQDYELVTSDEVANNNNKSGVEVTIRIDEVTPDGQVNGEPIGHRMKIVVESEVVDGVWTALAQSPKKRVQSEDAESMMTKLAILERNPVDPDQSYDIGDGLLYNFSSHPGDKIRVKLVVREDQPNSASALQSVKVTGFVNFVD